MKDFLNGCAVRVTRENEMEFLRMCEARGLKWRSGHKATEWTPGYYFVVDGYYMNYNFQNSGALTQGAHRMDGCTREKPFSEVVSLPHCFAEFLAGDIDLIVTPTEMPEFLDLCTEHGLKWSNGDAPRVGMRRKQTPSEGRIFYTDSALPGTLRTSCVTLSYYASVKRAPIEFKYVNRTAYKAPESKTAKAPGFHLSVDIASNPDMAGRVPKPTSHEIVITGKLGERTVTASKLENSVYGTESTVATARCAPHDTYSFDTGAVVALAKLMGSKAFEKGVAEARHAFFKESLDGVAASAKRLGDAMCAGMREGYEAAIKAARENPRAATRT